MKETFYVMGKKVMGGVEFQLHGRPFTSKADAVWFAKRMSGEYRWTRVVKRFS